MAKLLCMEVGTSTVRLAEVVKRGKVVEVTKTYVFDTPDDATRDGKVRLSDNIIMAIKNGIIDSGIKATDVYFVVESTKILFKQVELPFVNKRQIQSTLELSFQDIFPVEETLYHISYVFEKAYEKNGQKMMALDVFAIPNDLTESYYQLAVSLELNAKGLTDTSRSMISLFPSSFKNRNVAMVNINESVSTLTISVDGNMIFNKTIPHGVGDAIQHVINYPLTMDNIGVSDATGLLYTQNILMRQMPSGISEDANEEEKLRYSVTTSIVSLTKAIESTFAAFLAKENIQIQEFHLSGLGAGFSGITQLLTSEFGIPVNVIQQEGNLRINQSAADDPLLLSCYPCVGAVIDEANFFTKDEQAGGAIAQRKKMDKLFLAVGALTLVATVGYSGYSYLQAKIKHQEVFDENLRLTKRVDELRALGVEDAYNDYMTAISYNEEVLNLYNQTRSGNEDMTVFLLELEQTLPTSARVTSMEINPATATVSFKCEDKFVAAGVLHLLRNMKTTRSMECVGVAEEEATGEIMFSCDFVLKQTAEREAEKAEQEGQNPDDPNLDVPSDEDTPEQTEPEEEKLLAELAEPNTEMALHEITIGEAVVDMRALTIEAFGYNGFIPNGNIFGVSNDAINLGGLTYSNDDGLAFDVVGDVNVEAIAVNNETVLFANGLHVGMTIEDALAAIGISGLTADNGYIILKNEQNTMILQADFDGAIVETIYLINNSMFGDDAPAQGDVVDNTEDGDVDVNDQEGGMA